MDFEFDEDFINLDVEYFEEIYLGDDYEEDFYGSRTEFNL